MTGVLALLVDRCGGEPPLRVHPVVWIGHYLGWAGRRTANRAPWVAFLLGAAWWCIGAAAFTGLFWGAARALALLPLWANLLGGAILLKPLLSLRLLTDEVQGVEIALSEGLDAGRRRLSRIVSRDTSALSEGEVRESALESLSENLSDSVVAPLFWFLLLGLPGAALYRFANTADAMWGYRDHREWSGKWAARFDDVLNLIPARLTALALWCVGPRPRATSLAGLGAEARKTPSPNSGWPMAALALVSGLRFGKPGVYVLNPSGRVPISADLPGAVRRCTRAAWCVAGLMAAMELVVLLMP